MNEQELSARRAKLLAKAAEEGRTAEFLNNTHFAVQSKSHPLMRRVVTIDANSGYATSCSGITFDQTQCPAFAVRGVCTHSALSEAAFAQLAPVPTCDSHILQDMKDSIDWSRVDLAPGEWPTPEAEREEHLEKQTAHFSDVTYKIVNQSGDEVAIGKTEIVDDTQDPFSRFDKPTPRAMTCSELVESRKAENAAADNALLNHNDDIQPLRRGGVRH